MRVLSSLLAVPEHARAAARAAGAFMLVGAAFLSLFTLLSERFAGDQTLSIAVVIAALVVMGTRAWRFPSTVSSVELILYPPVVSCVVAFQNYYTHDGSAGAQLFLLWPVIYAALFLSVAQALLTVVVTVAAEAAALTHIHTTPDLWLTDTASLTIAFAMAVAVVHSLRHKNAAIMVEVARQANEDLLTGLANRRAFMATFEAELAVPGRDVSLLTVDIDRFKTVNDTLGHGGGDQILRQVADALRRTVRCGDVIARLGGDEFVVLLRDCTADDAATIAESIRLDVASSVPGVSVSIGAAATGPGRTTTDSVMEASDGALYEAKSSGRDTVRVAA